ncbi:MAG TPA: OmpA family protein [Candidatus Treponema faecavium]|nr:OmpA family protein [Candidatus Treponema faecavium]
MRYHKLFSLWIAFFITAACWTQTVQEDLGYLIFMPDQSTFAEPEKAAAELDDIAAELRARSLENTQILIDGYTADVDNGVDEWKLSEDRAARVVEELKIRGIDISLFLSDGRGSTYRWGDNTTEQQRRPNRRVTIILEQTIAVQEEAEEIPAPPAPYTAQTPDTPDEPLPPVARQSAVQRTAEQEGFPVWLILLIILAVIVIGIAVVIIIKTLSSSKKEAAYGIRSVESSRPYQYTGESYKTRPHDASGASDTVSETRDDDSKT